MLVNVKKLCFDIAALLYFTCLVRLEEATLEFLYLNLASSFHGYHLGFRHKTGGHSPTSLYCDMGCYFSFGFPEGNWEVVFE